MARAALGLGALVVAGHGHAGGSSALDAELAAIVSDPAHPLASLSVLAIRDARIVYHRQFGHRWIDNADRRNDKPAGPATLYRIASISKLVTTLGVLRLVEAGKLSLDRDIGDHLGYRVRNPHFPEVPITLRMLLGHTSSLRDDAGYSWAAGKDIRDVLTPGGALHGRGAMWSRDAPPGAWFQYANLPWGVVGTIMEKVTGERFDRLMQRLVLDPMGMQGGFDPAELPPERIANIATLYRKATAGDTQAWDARGPWIAQVDDYSVAAPVGKAGAAYPIGTNATVSAPQGGLRASAADLGRVMLMLMNRGMHEGRRFLSAGSVDAMLSRQWRHDGGGNGAAAYGSRKGRFNAWGLGNQHFLDVSGPDSGDRLVERGGFRAVGHLGDAYGLSSAFAFERDTKSGLIFLIGGTGFDPETYPGTYSSFHRHEERILTALHRHALAAKPD